MSRSGCVSSTPVAAAWLCLSQLGRAVLESPWLSMGIAGWGGLESWNGVCFLESRRRMWYIEDTPKLTSFRKIREKIMSKHPRPHIFPLALLPLFREGEIIFPVTQFRQQMRKNIFGEEEKRWEMAQKFCGYSTVKSCRSPIVVPWDMSDPTYEFLEVQAL